MLKGPWTRAGHAAAELGLSTQAVRNLLRSGKLAGYKDPEGRWLIEVESLTEYLALHGRHKPAVPGLGELERKLDELTRAVGSLQESNFAAARLLEVTERERDSHRAEAAAARETALRLIGSSRETRAAVFQLLTAVEHQEEALVQLLTPGSLEDLMPTRRART
jgi:helix-turn-helix protein